MADPLSVTSSVLAIATVAFQLSKSTYTTISSFRSQRQDVQAIQSDTAALAFVLELICKQIEKSPKDKHFDALKEPVLCCTTILKDIHDCLAECTRHAKNERDSVRTWLKLQFREKTFAEMKERLSSYKNTLTDNARQDRQTTQESLDELTKLTDRTREELEDQQHQILGKISTAEASIKALLEKDRAQTESCLDSLEKARTERAARAHIIVSDNTATGHGTRMIAGTDTSQPTFNLSVTNNRAEDGASMASGVYSPEVLVTLLQQSSAPPAVVSVFQTMQTGNFDPQSPAVQALLQQHPASSTSITAIVPKSIEEAHVASNKPMPALREHDDANQSVRAAR